MQGRTEPPEATPGRGRGRAQLGVRLGLERRDHRWLVAAIALVGIALVVGLILPALGVQLLLSAPPLYGQWNVHVGIGTPMAMLLAAAGVRWSAGLSERLAWRRLLAAGWATGLLWIVSLALVDGWARGWTQRLTDSNEYLHDVPRIHGIGEFVAGFSSLILDFQPGRWTTHVSAHPPLATLFFVALDRIGLRGGAWAGLAVVLVGSLSTVAVPVTLRALGAARAARRVVPFVAFFPGAVWIGVSADGMFTGLAATGLALSVLGVTGRSRWSVVACLGGGLLLGCVLYLSYGLVLFGTIAASAALASLCTVVARAQADARAPAHDHTREHARADAGYGLHHPRNAVTSWAGRWGIVLVGVAIVVAGFERAGFSWLDGVRLVQVRYYQGIASERPYSYFVWANFAALALCAGPMVAPALRRAVPAAWGAARTTVKSGFRPPTKRADLVVPALVSSAALLAIVVADLSGLSKAETERIWLPFAVWLLPALTLLPRDRHRAVLGVQVVTALIVNHVVLTGW